MRLHKRQSEIVKAPLNKKIFLEGMAGAGKTTVGVRRLRHLITSKVPAESILVLVPQKALAIPYDEEIRDPKRKAGGNVTVHTIGSLAFHMVDLFWPLLASNPEIGFGSPNGRPNFLSLELVQYYMTKSVGEEIENRDFFNSVHINRNRLFSQIVDNLNKAAVIGFDYREIGERLKEAWRGDINQRYIYDDAQECANIFREFCLNHNLLDFSLQVTLFIDHLLELKAPRKYLFKRFKHLIVDNIEEDNPATHTLLQTWLPDCQSALIIYDTQAGYRRFLGSDADNAYTLKTFCDEQVSYEKTFVMSDDLQALDVEFARVFQRESGLNQQKVKGNPRDALIYTDSRYHPQMINWVAENIASLIHDEGVPPREIVILAPLLSDSLRFALMHRFDEMEIPARSHRPSRALREEPAARALITLAKLAHPQWELPATSFDVTYALMSIIQQFDLSRARLLTEIVYKKGKLHPFENIKSDFQRRITYDFGALYDTLYTWLEDYQASEEPVMLDVFFSRLFGEVLSQPEYGFHKDFDASKVAKNLVDSAKNFRWTVRAVNPDIEIGKEYLQMVDSGVIADLYIRDWRVSEEDSILIAPAYTYLMSNQPVDYQFWVNVGSNAWAQRLYQPLTHPYVLSMQWQRGQIWTDADEVEANQDALFRLASGLVKRCRKRIYLGFSQFGEQGFEQRGDLLEAIQRILRDLSMTPEGEEITNV